MKQCIKDSGETRRKILYAAKKEFAAKGFNGARMSSIAALAGVNQALLHYHFTSKEKIYLTIFRKLAEDVFGMYWKMMLEEISSWKYEPDEKLCSIIYLLVKSELYIRDDEFHKMVAHEFAEDGGIMYKIMREFLIPQLFRFDEILKEGIDKGIFEISSTAMLTLNIISFVKDLSHGEEFFKDTDVYRDIYNNKQEMLYNFMIEFAFKTLRPEGKDLHIPVLDKTKKDKLDSILVELRNDINNNFLKE